jgi:hypothetical protein
MIYKTRKRIKGEREGNGRLDVRVLKQIRMITYLIDNMIFNYGQTTDHTKQRIACIAWLQTL